MTFVVDIDDTLLKYDKAIGRVYAFAKPNQKLIDDTNKAFKKGHKIILWTGRNWDKYEMTKRQLKSFGISHHELVMGKPQGVYIDQDAEKDFRKFKRMI